MEKPKAVLFDAYGTLFDVYSVGLLAEQLFPGQGAALGVLWRDKQIEYTRLVTTSNEGEHYKPFWELTRAGLRVRLADCEPLLTVQRHAQLARSTPTVDGANVYVSGKEGQLFCLDAAKGTKVWEVAMRKELGAKVPDWVVKSSVKKLPRCPPASTPCAITASPNSVSDQTTSLAEIEPRAVWTATAFAALPGAGCGRPFPPWPGPRGRASTRPPA